jgi:predicted nucleotidyltransferase
LSLQLAKELQRQLQNILEEQIQVTLFGSQARGSASSESDVDVLVILPDLEKNTLDAVFDVAWEIGFEAGKVLSVVPATREVWGEPLASSFFRAIQ